MIRRPRRQLEETIDRVLALLALYRSLTKAGRPPAHLSDLLRGALILTAAALDAYMHDVLVAASSAAERRGLLGARAARWVASDPEMIRLPQGTQRRRRTRHLVAARLERVSIMASGAIEEHLLRVIGAGPPWAAAAASMTTQTDPVDHLLVRARLDGFVQRRHQIAHRGDRTDRGGLRAVSADYVEDQTVLVTQLAGAVDVVVRTRVR